MEPGGKRGWGFEGPPRRRHGGAIFLMAPHFGFRMEPNGVWRPVATNSTAVPKTLYVSDRKLPLTSFPKKGRVGGKHKELNPAGGARPAERQRQ